MKMVLANIFVYYFAYLQAGHVKLASLVSKSGNVLKQSYLLCHWIPHCPRGFLRQQYGHPPERNGSICRHSNKNPCVLQNPKSASSAVFRGLWIYGQQMKNDCNVGRGNSDEVIPEINHLNWIELYISICKNHWAPLFFSNSVNLYRGMIILLLSESQISSLLGSKSDSMIFWESNNKEIVIIILLNIWYF